MQFRGEAYSIDEDHLRENFNCEPRGTKRREHKEHITDVELDWLTSVVTHETEACLQ